MKHYEISLIDEETGNSQHLHIGHFFPNENDPRIVDMIRDSDLQVNITDDNKVHLTVFSSDPIPNTQRMAFEQSELMNLVRILLQMQLEIFRNGEKQKSKQ